MQSSRLKNIIILILLLTNLSLAAVVVSRQADHQEGLEQVRQQLVTLFAAENVELDEDLISSQTPPLSRTLTRDTQQEEDLAAFLLGENLRWSDQGGGIHLYGSDRGGVQFLDNGSFDAAGSLSEGASAPEVCRAFCKEFGYGDLTFSSRRHLRHRGPVLRRLPSGQLHRLLYSGQRRLIDRHRDPSARRLY